MAKYRVFADYYFTVDCGVIEADTEERAKEKALDNIIDSSHTLCYECEQKMLDHPMLDEDTITVELEE